MSVWMGVDLGNARVGLALSDPELTFAHPAGNLQAYGDYDTTVEAAQALPPARHKPGRTACATVWRSKDSTEWMWSCLTSGSPR